MQNAKNIKILSNKLNINNNNVKYKFFNKDSLSKAKTVSMYIGFSTSLAYYCKYNLTYDHIKLGFAGIVGNSVCVTFLHPLDTLNSYSKFKSNSTLSLTEMILSIKKQYGLKSLYNGYNFNLFYNFIYSLGYFACYKQLKEYWCNRIENSRFKAFKSGGYLISSFVADVVFNIASFPIMLMKFRMQTSQFEDKNKKITYQFSNAYYKESNRSLFQLHNNLFKGFYPFLSQVTTVNVLLFYFFEVMRDNAAIYRKVIKEDLSYMDYLLCTIFSSILAYTITNPFDVYSVQKMTVQGFKLNKSFFTYTVLTSGLLARNLDGILCTVVGLNVVEIVGKQLGVSL